MKKISHICNFCGEEVDPKNCLCISANRYDAVVIIEWGGCGVELCKWNEQAHFCNENCLKAYLMQEGREK
ncbi:hypothetical protein [Methanolacinia petrolearia]|uniref:hypothetical protein n=1 Tax=Methanolacinia petrolearia TaxID=54120 RepID=UPI0011D13805|nr:hypothetical protein [Methanolacinia petrolearia]